MTPDQQFARWIKGSVLAFAALFIYFLLADLKIPLTPQAMATRGVVKVAPQVSGRLQTLYVHNNQTVQRGDLLFALDPQPFRLAVEQAQLKLEEALQENAELDAQIVSAQADVSAAKVKLDLAERDAHRISELYARHVISQQSKDEADSTLHTAHATLKASEAALEQLRVSRGEQGDINLRLRVARNTLDQAKLNLTYSQVRASQDGIVTNLQLVKGAYASAGSPLLALVANQVDIIADFREKALRQVNPGYQALIAFDGQPGTIYAAQVTSLDAGVSAGQFDADGELATPSESDRWVRDAQRLRLHLSLTSDSQHLLPAGARATVQLLPENPMLATLARLQIHLLSLLHYIY
ncbi:Multidrug resistance efflux pump [Aeromonas sp. RU39B]|jgi:multidrug resistance efflux pump|uniref:HlyD family secretion protein n=1 Tax=Aeromonas sp. RU39B TaxID=1907416 RepID=UPI000954848E|nr:HlyD family secretion protein [Aeromonas sp. RU39B]SIQ59823.1 Multidrug resistance efflux pump [Aeromonas sp. RU39B]